ncbi:ribonuclease H-like domain-containing protein, partial [Tanacetum coccineum]
MVSVRCVLSLVVQNQWSIFQLDVNNAFLYGELVEAVYMSLPDGYYVPGDNRVCKLKRSLYGLKQAPRRWNEKLPSVLIELGFSQSKNDYSLFVKSDGDVFVVLLVYVDDIIIVTGNSVDEIKKVLRYLKGAPGNTRVGHGVTFNNVVCCAELEQRGVRLYGYSVKDKVFLGSCLVIWKSNKQSVLAKSSAEAEYRAMSSIAANPVFHERTKHFEIDLYFLREKIAGGVFKTCKVQSQDNVADLLTKGLCSAEHRKFCDKLNLCNLFQ